MNRNRFCTIVRTDDGRFLRPLLPGGHQPNYDRFLRSHPVRRVWNPGRVVRMEFQTIGASARPTHPEDSIIIPGRIWISEQVLTAVDLSRRIQGTARTQLSQLYPNITVDWEKPFYVGSPRLECSVGYLRVRNLRLVQDGAPGFERLKVRVTPCGERASFLLPIKDPELLNAIGRNRYRLGDRIPANYVFMGLANPFPHKSGEERAYLQLLHILP